jgi:uncharacterized metal-binding protein YceD (DUF177 family)
VTQPEFSRLIDRRLLTAFPVNVDANEDERAALAKRFGLVSIGRLEAMVELIADGEAVDVRGRIAADVVQSCAISGDDLSTTIDEPLTLRFVPERPIEAAEIELEADELDEIPFKGDVFDLGEAVAQSLSLAIDPYAVGPNAEQTRKEVGLNDKTASGPFAALAALKKQ